MIGRKEFNVVDLFTEEEMNMLKVLIQNHVSVRIRQTVEDLSEYHLHAPDVVHQALCPKHTRVLDDSSAIEIMKMGAISKLLASYKDYKISRVMTDIGKVEDRPEFCIRLVRPNTASDNSFPHCDCWYDSLMKSNYGTGNSMKFWIPIIYEPGINGLQFYPEAPDNLEYEIRERNGQLKPTMKCDVKILGKPVMPSPQNGQAILFGDNILHVGAPNTSNKTRVSMEILLVKYREKITSTTH